MKNLRKIVSLLLCLCMLLGVTALAEETAEITPDTVVATMNGNDITWADVEPIYQNVVAQYGTAADDTVLRAVAVENTIIEKLLMQKAVEFGVAELSEEEITALEADASYYWAYNISSVVTAQHPEITSESSQEEWDAASAEAEAYLIENSGYTLESLTEEIKHYAVIDKVRTLMLQDVTVTDEEVEAHYQQLLANDKAMFENDIAAYVDYVNQVEMMAMYAQMYGMANNMDYPWYKPAGFRAVKHILMIPDEELMNAYTDLQARYEEHQYAEMAAAEGNAEATETAEEAAGEASEPVTIEQVNEAEAAILASLADKIEEITTKLNEGADFDALIAEYGEDPGMNAEPYMTAGYEVCAASNNYVPEFVEAAMSIAEVGGVSAPYLSSYGVHIVKYIADVEGGPVEMTAEQREAKRAQLLQTKQDMQYSAIVQTWKEDVEIAYTGAVATLADLEAQSAAAAE